MIQSSGAGSQQHLLVRLDAHADPEPPGWQARTVGVEELALAYLRGSRTTITLPPLEATR